MFLKNYTSSVPVSETVRRIESILIKCGVLDITKEYGPVGTVTALRFRIKEGAVDFAVRLPADKERALDALWANYVDGDQLNNDGHALAWPSHKKKRRKDFSEQAERTAWKIIQDWVEVQMSMIQMRQAEGIEVFLPYIWNHNSQTTFYGSLKTSNFKALLPEKSLE